MVSSMFIARSADGAEKNGVPKMRKLIEVVESDLF
jgi:hypothetical protein